MRVFVTGATGFVGSAVVAELIGAGHQVIGLCRSDDRRAALAAAGARGASRLARGPRKPAARRRAVGRRDPYRLQPRLLEVRGELPDDRRAIEALGAALDRLRPAADRHLRHGGARARADGDRRRTRRRRLSRLSARSEAAAAALAARGVRARRCGFPPPVHGTGEHGFVARSSRSPARKASPPISATGSTAGRPRIGSTPRALPAGARARRGGGPFHAVAEEGVPFKDIAGAIGRRLNVPVVSQSPEEAAEHFGWFARFAGVDSPASSERTRSLLGWQPGWARAYRRHRRSTSHNQTLAA